MKHGKLTVAIFLSSFFIAPSTHADSTLVYDLIAPNGHKTEYTISISGRWLRLESKPRAKADYTIMDTGRMLKFEVSDKEKSFQVTRMGRLYWPSSPATSPKFKPVPKKGAVAGVRCQPVQEIGMDKKPIVEHCMSPGGTLGLNAREMITLSRLFMASRRMGLGWPGVATADERQVSVSSKAAEGIKMLFRSVKHGRIDNSLLKIPVNYKRLKPDLPPGKKI